MVINTLTGLFPRFMPFDIKINYLVGSANGNDYERLQWNTSWAYEIQGIQIIFQQGFILLAWLVLVLPLVPQTLKCSWFVSLKKLFLIPVSSPTRSGLGLLMYVALYSPPIHAPGDFLADYDHVCVCKHVLHGSCRPSISSNNTRFELRSAFRLLVSVFRFQLPFRALIWFLVVSRYFDF